MENIKYYNAGAGSGKTYTLVSELVKLIKTNKAKPQEVILTTFTEKAATEFREKVKARLYKEGMFEEALQIDNAMIGTVHSVCTQLINKYWYFLGLAPNMGVLDEDSQKFYQSQSMGILPEDDEKKVLIDTYYNFEFRSKDESYYTYADKDFWCKHLSAVIAYATNYGITDFSRSEEESVKFIEQFVDPATDKAFITDEELDIMLQEARDYVDKSKRIQKKEAYYNSFNTVSAGRHNKTISWYINTVSVLEPKYGDKCMEVSERIPHIWRSTKVFDLQKRYIHTLFELASRWQKKYKEFKKEKNLIDFNDMEFYLNELLNNETARNDISQSYRYLFVDEFQDCSPIQIKIFSALSELMQYSYWVGDYKQSIYGFRGTDIDMIKAVTDSIGDIQSLEYSWRSLPRVVNANNGLFKEIFASKLKEKEIRLTSQRDDEPSQTCLRFYISKEKKNLDALCVRKLLKEGMKPNEIAVLSRTRATMEKIAKDLHALCIPCSLGQKELASSPTWMLVKSLLDIVDNCDNMLARAQVAFLTERHYGAREIVEERLECGKKCKDFLSSVPLVKKILAMRDSLCTLSLPAMLEQMVIELGLFQIVKEVEDNALYGTDCLQSILSLAHKYEQYCLQMNMSADINGFIQYFKEMKPTGFGNPEGVQLYTYHGSKGLEWKYVILTSLDYKIESSSSFLKNNIYGVCFEHTSKPTPENPFPEVFLRLTPWIYDTNKGNVPTEIATIIRKSDTYKNTLTSIQEEESRLLYVGMTRPRDVMVLSLKKTENGADLTLLHEIGYSKAGTKEPEYDGWDIFDTGDKFVNFTPTEDEIAELSIPEETTEKMLILPDIDLSKKLGERRYISPSGVKATSQIGDVKDFGHRIPLSGNDYDMAIIGNCIHHVFACIEDKRAVDIEVGDIIQSHALERNIPDAESAKKAWSNLVSYLTSTYGPAVRTWHERPFRMERDGQTVVGSIDLVWQTTEGDILIDYKTNPEGASIITNPKSDHFAGRYGGQLNIYREALEAAGENVIKTLLYYPVSGLLVEINK